MPAHRPRALVLRAQNHRPVPSFVDSSLTPLRGTTTYYAKNSRAHWPFLADRSECHLPAVYHSVSNIDRVSSSLRHASCLVNKFCASDSQIGSSNRVQSPLRNEVPPIL